MDEREKSLIIRADARALPLADASVDLIVTSPPYFALRSYTDDGEHYAGQIGAELTPAAYIASLIECTREWMRVLKPSGSIWVNLGDKYNSGSGSGPQSGLQGGVATTRGNGRGSPVIPRTTIPNKSLMLLPERYRIACVDELGLIARAVVVWSKPNGLPESVTDRVRRSHEDWVHLTKMPRYFAAVDEIRERFADARPLVGMTWEQRKQRGDNMRQGEQSGTFGGNGMSGNLLGKLPGSVWEIATEPLKVPKELGVDHFAAFPKEWPRRIISAWCPPGGVVLDPFGGTGTTALVAHALGRTGISVDRSADYCRIARWRTTDSGELAKAMRVEKPPVEVTGQTTLFDMSAYGARGGSGGGR